MSLVRPLALTALAALVTSSVRAAPPAPVDKEKVITVADVAKVSKQEGVQVVPRMSRPGAGGDVNFANGAGKLVCMVIYMDQRMFDGGKTMKQMNPTPVKGVGDEAYTMTGGPTPEPATIAVRKGDRAAQITTFYDLHASKPYLDVKQLEELAKIAASRL